MSIFASRDWHPQKHCSFKPHGGAWPEHCVVGTAGAAFAEGLQLPPDAVIIDTAIDPYRVEIGQAVRDLADEVDQAASAA